MNKIISIVKIITWLSGFFFISGCGANDGCIEYSKLIDDIDINNALVKWADDEVFSRSFDREDFERFDKFVGPGKGGANFDLENSGIRLPKILDGYSIRSVGPNRNQPDVILVGKRRYQGILITRAEFKSSISRIGGEPLRIEKIVGRAGLICYND